MQKKIFKTINKMVNLNVFFYDNINFFLVIMVLIFYI